MHENAAPTFRELALNEAEFQRCRVFNQTTLGVKNEHKQITQESVIWKTLGPYSMRVSEPFSSSKLPTAE